MSFNMLKHCRATHLLEIQPFLSVVLISGCSYTGEWLTCWIFSHSNSRQRFWSVQTLESNSHAGCVKPFLSRVLICSNTGELTYWMCVTVCSAILVSGSDLFKHSHSGCMFSHSCQWFWSARTQKSNSHTASCVLSHPYQWFWSVQTGAWLTNWMYV